MRKFARIRIALLVLMLAVSHVALLSHVTAHFEPDLQQCELCVAQAQLLAAIPSCNHTIPADSEFGARRFDSPPCAIPAQPLYAYHQRAPPLSSA